MKRRQSSAHVFLAYGSFTDPLTSQNFVICRIAAGVEVERWQTMMRKLQRTLKAILGLQRHEPAPYWNLDGLATAKEQTAVWESQKARRLDWHDGDWHEASAATAAPPASRQPSS